MQQNQQLVDIVIAWVDGNDPILIKKRQNYMEKQIAEDPKQSTRFASDYEIYYAIASILKYVPYCRTIYIITDQQKPQYLQQLIEQRICTPEKIKIIDHIDLFRGYECVLPTFNSLTIETMLWNINELSDQFIYLNDDFFFNAPSLYQDFIQDNKIIIYGHWVKNTSKKLKYKYRQWLEKKFNKKAEARYTTAQMLSADRLNLNSYFEIHHRPHILNRIILQEYFQDNPLCLDQQIQYKFRNIQQFLPVGLMNHLAIKNEQAILKNDIKIAYLKPTEDINIFIKNIQTEQIKYGCIQSLDLFDIQQRQQLQQVLVKKFADFLPKSIVQEAEKGQSL
ncbi:capsular polysaccharide biosynthesis protein [Acinetobacter qingfengensis]|uniref:Capsular polysaccharide biosynthesis protein n=1 Tax=Acinetobacter qingfengensis TaxID=1262585 RepID=A0A1E7R3J4_9GAMM|nr:Stealth CR1 domain-containing protein [Acinetobacter qingfengensis]KAA8733186.1 capsular polysaccharide biosynthesis protein [Acinetobacter qingfengensis]OEY93842.1 capsular polysaccharide biosynthesis protein [Acinetobacter qingfengensis]